MTKFIKVLKKYSSIADRMRKAAMFVQDYPEIVEVLQDMPFLEVVGCTVYVWIIVYIWKDFLREEFPILYDCLSKMAS